MKIISLADFKNLLNDKFYLPFIINDVFPTYHLKGDIFVWQQEEFKKRCKDTVKNRNWKINNLTVIEAEWKSKWSENMKSPRLYFFITAPSPEQLAGMINRLSKMKAFL